jgi:hypothetical protein
MNKTLGRWAAIANIAFVAVFAVSMLVPSLIGSYISSIFIALSFAPMICAFASGSRPETKAAGSAAMVFAGIYAAFILLVYFAQVTTVRKEALSEQAAALLDYTTFGLFFSYDLLGYAMMALSTFFAAMTVAPKTKGERALRWLLRIHGVFAVSCFVMPMLNVFSPDMPGADWVGTAVLEFWCAYFIPVGILSAVHFSKKAQ